MRLPPLHRATLLRRYKRFLADMELEDGRRVVAHCPNSGAMDGCAIPGRPAWLSFHPSPKRKLQWTWQLARPRRALVLINTQLPNTIVAHAIAQNRVPQLSGYSHLARERPYGWENSRIDILLEHPKRAPCYVEVKSVTLRGFQGEARFPDAITQRGTRHLRELMGQASQGDRAVLFLLVGRGDTTHFEPADDIDPLYAKTLLQARQAGVEILCYRARIRTRAITLGPPVEMHLCWEGSTWG